MLRKGERMHRVLVPTDFSSTSRAAVRYALALTVPVGGEMLLLHVIEGAPLRRYIVHGAPEGLPDWLDPMGPLFHAPRPQEVIYHDCYEEAREKLLTWLPPGLSKRARALVTVGKVADEIVRVAREQKADAIVMEAQGKRRVRHLLRRTVTERVIRKVAIPVITIWGIGASCSPHDWMRELAWMDGPGEPPTGQRAHGERFRTPRPSLAAK
jgi:universal stress protein A